MIFLQRIICYNLNNIVTVQDPGRLSGSTLQKAHCANNRLAVIETVTRLRRSLILYSNQGYLPYGNKNGVKIYLFWGKSEFENIFGRNSVFSDLKKTIQYWYSSDQNYQDIYWSMETGIYE